MIEDHVLKVRGLISSLIDQLFDVQDVISLIFRITCTFSRVEASRFNTT
jgi:hypothetical protein